MRERLSYYKPVHDFFGMFSLQHSLKLLDKMLLASAANTPWSGRFPANAVYFSEKLTSLAAAVFATIRKENIIPAAILENRKDVSLWQLTRYETYCGHHHASTPWHFFPRSLTQKEFCNPYKALRRFTRYHSAESWQGIIKDLLHAALSPHTITDLDDSISLISVRLHLHKLIEAAHLVHIRISATRQLPHQLPEIPENSQTG